MGTTRKGVGEKKKIKSVRDKKEGVGERDKKEWQDG